MLFLVPMEQNTHRHMSIQKKNEDFNEELQISFDNLSEFRLTALDSGKSKDLILVA